MCGPGYIEPALIVQLGSEQFFVDAVTEYLRSAARTTIEPSRLQIGQHLFHRLVGYSLDLRQLDHRKGLDLDAGSGILYGPNEIQIVLVWQLRIYPGHNVDLTNGNLVMLMDLILDILDAQHIPSWVAGRGVKRTKLASL